MKPNSPRATMTEPELLHHSSHWGEFRARMTPVGLDVTGLETDFDPSPLIRMSLGVGKSWGLSRYVGIGD